MVKRKLIARIIIIGLLHSSVYLYLIPKVIFPMFGESTVSLVITITVIVSLLILATAVIGKKRK